MATLELHPDTEGFIASNPENNAWVSAHAGTGKTHVLVDRLMRLLYSGTRPEHILCLTYTKAAASEMHARLFARLGTWAMRSDEDLEDALKEIGVLLDDFEDEPKADSKDSKDAKATKTRLLENARQLFTRALETPGGIKIQTIHAFCQNLLAYFPLESGVTAGFKVLADSMVDERLAMAQRLLHQEAEKEPFRAKTAATLPLSAAVGYMAPLLGESSFSEFLTDIGDKRKHFKEIFAKYGGLQGVLEEIATSFNLKDAINTTQEEGLLEEFFATRRGQSAPLTACLDVFEKGTSQDQTQARTLRAVLDILLAPTVPSLASLWGKYSKIFLTDKGVPTSRLLTAKLQKDYPKDYAYLCQEQDRVYALHQKIMTRQVAHSTACTFIIARTFLSLYEKLKGERNELDFDDLIDKARYLLRRSHFASWALYKLDGGVRHILIDEAQDTSPVQWEILQSICEEFFAGNTASSTQGPPRTVFAVGDAKQSIFSFQGADPYAFQKMNTWFESRVKQASQQWANVNLSRSRRARPLLVKVVNDIFTSPTLKAASKVFATQPPHLPFRKEGRAGVELWPLEVAQADAPVAAWNLSIAQDTAQVGEPRRALAERIASMLQGLFHRQEPLTDEGRPACPGDVLILFRKREASRGENSLMSEITRSLINRGIPVSGKDRVQLYDRIEIHDLLAAMNFALLPNDDFTLAALLKSPFCGLDEAELFAVCYHRKKRSLWQIVQREAPTNAKLKMAVDFLQGLLQRADFMPPFEFFSHILEREGGRKNITMRLGQGAMEPVDMFLNLTEDYERLYGTSLQGFSHWIMAQRYSIKRDAARARNEVRLMSVHGAKGLEAPIVILPDTTSSPHTKTPKLVARGASLMAPDMYYYNFSKAEACVAPLQEGIKKFRHHAKEEHARLLYVACTRARERLIVCGVEPKIKLPEDCWYNAIKSTVNLRWNEKEKIYFEQETAPQETLPHGRLPQATAQEEKPDKAPLPSWVAAPPAAEKTPGFLHAPSSFYQNKQEQHEHDMGKRAAQRLSPIAVARGQASHSASLRQGKLLHAVFKSFPAVPPESRRYVLKSLLAQNMGAFSQDEQAAQLEKILTIFNNPQFARLFEKGSRGEVPIAGTITLASGQALQFSGRMDRLLVTKEEVLVVDYKTWRHPPDKAHDIPLAYVRQMALYRALLQGLYAQKITCGLLWTSRPALTLLQDAQLAQAMPLAQE